MAKLTATGIRNLSTPGKYGDGNGLFLVVAASGAKRWVQRITIRGKRCDLGLGPLSSVSLAEARELAARNRKEALAGGDPLRDKREAAAVMTFEEAAREVHRLHLPTAHPPTAHPPQRLPPKRPASLPRPGAAPMARSTFSSGKPSPSSTPIYPQAPRTTRPLRLCLSLSTASTQRACPFPR